MRRQAEQVAGLRQRLRRVSLVVLAVILADSAWAGKPWCKDPLPCATDEIPCPACCEDEDCPSQPWECWRCDSENQVCVFEASIAFAGVQYYSGQSGEGFALIPILNPEPRFELHEVNILPAQNGSWAAVHGQVRAFAHPLTAADVTMNGTPVTTLNLIDAGPDDQGPFLYSYLQHVWVGPQDLLIRSQATNGLGNRGWGKSQVIAEFDGASFLGHYAINEPPTPNSAWSLGNYDFKITVNDPQEEDDVVSASVDTGVESREIELERVGGVFESKPLYLLPENLDLPASVPPEVAATRLRAALGQRITACYTDDRSCEVEVKAILTGTLWSASPSWAPLAAVRAGLPKDVGAGGADDRRVWAQMGLPGDHPAVGIESGTGLAYIDIPAAASNYKDAFLPQPVYSRTIRLYRASDDEESGEYDLFVSDGVFPMASDTQLTPVVPNDATLIEVQSGGFIRIGNAVEPVLGDIVVNVLVDGLGAALPAFRFGNIANFQNMMAGGQLPNFSKLVGGPGQSVQAWNAHTTFPSITFSAWPSWVTGKNPNVHGVVGSNFYRRNPWADPWWLGGPDMDGPVNHFNYLGIYPVFDVDIYWVWSGQGSLNEAIRPEVPTLYQAIGWHGLRSAVVYHQPWRGTTYREDPGAFQGFIDHEDSTGTALDAGTATELNNLFANPALVPPQVLTAYFAGLDTNVHNNVNYLAAGAGHLAITDRFVSTLTRHLENHNLFSLARFTFTGDHGLSRYGYVLGDDTYNDTHLLEIETTWDDELEDVFEAEGYDVLDFGWENDYTAVIGLNGGMAHVYVQYCSHLPNQNCLMTGDSDTQWTFPPRFAQDVMPIAIRFFENDIGLVADEPELLGSLDLILVRNVEAFGWNAPYEVLIRNPNGTYSTITVPAAIAANLVDRRYVSIALNLQRLQDIRSGDVLLFGWDICQNNGSGYYFGDGNAIPGWHGSLCETDMTIPVIFSYPLGAGADLSNFISTAQGILNQDRRITAVTPTVYKLLTGQNLP